MFLNHKTLHLRPRNPSARAKLFRCVTNPAIDLWSNVAIVYQFTHPEDKEPVAFPTLTDSISKFTSADWKRVCQVIMRDHERDVAASGDWGLFDEAPAPAAAAVEQPLKNEPLFEANPAKRKSRPVDVPVKVCPHPAVRKSQQLVRRTNQLLRPRSCRLQD